MSTLLRHHSTSAIDQTHHIAQAAQAASAATGLQGQSQSIALDQTPIQRMDSSASNSGEQRWMHRLKEMEKRLKAEREARLLDRRGARQRLEERSAENEELRRMLEKESRRASVAESVEGAEEESEYDEVEDERR
jgi:hypothetical protein